MRVLFCAVLLIAGLALLPVRRAAPASLPHVIPASTRDRQVLRIANRLADRHLAQAVAWLNRKRWVTHAYRQRTGAIDVHFRDGAEVVVLPRTRPLKVWRAQVGVVRPLVRAADGSAPGRALVLEPFADQLNLGDNAGSGEANFLTSAGFQVDVLRNGQVTIDAMKNLASYSVVYIETHSNILDTGPDAGDAIIATRDTDNQANAALIKDGSVLQVTVAGDVKGTLYLAIAANFFTQHTGVFPNSSMLYVNGCAVIGAPVFWAALQHQNVATLIGWDREVYSAVSDISAIHLLSDLVAGSTIASAVESDREAGLGTSVVGNATAHLGFDGDGEDTLARALTGTGATPTPTPTPTTTPTAGPTTTTTTVATVTPTATSATVHRTRSLRLVIGGSLRVGRAQTLRVTVRDRGGHPISGAHVSVSGAGLGHVPARVTGKRGTVTFVLKATHSGIVTIKASKRGYHGARSRLSVS